VSLFVPHNNFLDTTELKLKVIFINCKLLVMLLITQSIKAEWLHNGEY
jgi:hypothetical protein